MLVDNVKKSTYKKKRGTALGFWFFKLCVYVGGLPSAYGLLYFVCLYYLLFDTQAVSDSMAYINMRFPGESTARKYLHIYKLFVSQGKQLIDTYLITSNIVHYDFVVSGYNELATLLNNSKQGLILLTAHIGNWQAALSTLNNFEKPVYLVMRPEDNNAVKEYLRINKQWKDIKIISQEEHLGGVFEIITALKNGGIVAIMGDRRYNSKSIAIEFLGKEAYFPYGAFVIAQAVQCPMAVLIAVKVEKKTYNVDVTNVLVPHAEEGKDKHEKIKNSVKKFSAVLEKFINRYPYQCFLFEDIWKK